MVALMELGLNVNDNNQMMRAHSFDEFTELYKPFYDDYVSGQADGRYTNQDNFSTVLEKSLQQHLDINEFIDLGIKKDEDVDNEEDEEGNTEEATEDELTKEEEKRYHELGYKLKTGLMTLEQRKKLEALIAKNPQYANKNLSESEIEQALGTEETKDIMNRFDNMVNANKLTDLNNEPEKNRVGQLLNAYADVAQESLPQKDFEFIYAINQNFSILKDDDDKTTTSVKTIASTDGKKEILMSVKDLEGTGLNFAINSQHSLVMPDGTNSISPQQAAALAKFMFNTCALHNIDDFNFDKIKNLKVKGQDADGQEVDKPFKNAFEELLEKNKQEDTAQEWTPEQFDQWVKDFGLEGHNTDTPGTSKDIGDMTLDMRAFKSKVVARMNIMGFTNKRLIDTRRCMDGSIVICAYTNEIDMRHDNETSKGDVQRKKAFAVKIKFKKGVPTVSWYLPQGKVLEGSHARVMLEALKSQGCTHAYLPNAMDTSGKGQGAFWEAVAKSLVCPMAMPSGNQLKPQNIVDIMETLKKENDPSRNEVLQFKRRLLTQLENQEAFYSKTDKKYSLNNNLDTQMENLRGSINYDTFVAAGLPKLRKFILENSSLRERGDKQWNQLEVLAANQAVIDISENYCAIRAKYGNRDLTNNELIKELAIVIEKGVIDKDGNTLTEGTAQATKELLDIKYNGSHQSNEEKRMEAAMKAVAAAVMKNANTVSADIETNFSVKIPRDNDAAYAGAKVSVLADKDKPLTCRGMMMRVKGFVPSRSKGRDDD